MAILAHRNLRGKNTEIQQNIREIGGFGKISEKSSAPNCAGK
jgi:hypothetical protein